MSAVPSTLSAWECSLGCVRISVVLGIWLFILTPFKLSPSPFACSRYLAFSNSCLSDSKLVEAPNPSNASSYSLKLSLMLLLCLPNSSWPWPPLPLVLGRRLPLRISQSLTSVSTVPKLDEYLPRPWFGALRCKSGWPAQFSEGRSPRGSEPFAGIDIDIILLLPPTLRRSASRRRLSVMRDIMAT